jgi:hypothetical protein
MIKHMLYIIINTGKKFSAGPCLILNPIRVIAALVAWILILSINASAQDPIPLPDKPGAWTYGYLNDANTEMYSRQYGMTPEEAAVFRKKLDAIANALHMNPILADPKGVDCAAESRPMVPHGFETQPENYGFIGEINFRLPQWFNSKGRVYRQTIEPPRVTVFINNIHPLKRCAFNSGGPEGQEIKKAGMLLDEICKPDRIRELGPGVTLYDAAIVAGKPGKSLYLPCSVAEAYSRLTAFYEAAVKKEPAFGVMLDGIRQELKTVTPAQMKGPAYYGGMLSGITAEPNDAPLHLFNKDYFDRTMPKTAVQLIVIPIDADYFRKETDFAPNSVGFLRINQFLHVLDPAMLVKFID